MASGSFTVRFIHASSSWFADMKHFLRTYSLLAGTNRRKIVTLFSGVLILAAVIGWNEAWLTAKERQFVGQWYDAKPEGESIIVEFHADRRVSRAIGNRTSELGRWRMNDSRIEIYTPRPFVNWNVGFVASVVGLYQEVRFRLSRLTTGPSRWDDLVFHYFCVEESCDGSPVLDEVFVLGCTDRIDDDARFVRTLELAVQRDLAFAEHAVGQELPKDHISITNLGCPG